MNNATGEKRASVGIHKGRKRSVFAPGSPATNWQTYFPYAEPRDAQVNSIEQTIDTATDEGFTLLEGACGTGKTLVVLCAGLELVRDPTTQYQRVLCLTSVKQQLRAFENDLKAINNALVTHENPAGDGTSELGDETNDTTEQIDPVSALTLVGKADVCSYTNTGHIDDRAIYGKCEDLREPVRLAVHYANDGERAARELANDVRDEATTPRTRLGTDSWTAPYTPEFPETDDQNSRSYCPFYAQYRADTYGEDDTGYTPEGVLTPNELVSQASSDGLCPHAVMSDALQNAEVIVANYYHAFDAKTVGAMTGELLDGQTFVVCDEAHMLVPRVRDLLSDRLTRSTLTDAISEIEHRILEQSHRNVSQTLRQTLAEEGVGESTLRSFVELLHEAKFWLEQQAVEGLDAEDSDWVHTKLEDLPNQIQHPLRNPQTPQPDQFSRWVDENGYTDIMSKAGYIGEAVATALNTAANRHAAFESGEVYSDTVGRVFSRWAKCDHEKYFRTVELQQRRALQPSNELAWNQKYTVGFRLHNCLPAEDIAARLDRFGGGLLMSATLEPLDVYQRSIGLNRLADDGRPIRELTYGLPFPEKNRASYAVDLEKFTYKNRGGTKSRWRDPDQDALREHYASTVRTVVRTTPGNVLVAMPSYAEGEWIANVLRRSPALQKPILVDKSSANETTEELKAEFFAGGSKVLITSLRGTLTEGVDYDGDRLAACVVCGVPITNIRGPVSKALKTAYEREFGKHNGFDYAFTVPAVRKTRQALGRVIRGHDEVGVRVAADRRYASDHQWDDVRGYFPEYEQNEYAAISSDDLSTHLESFWNAH
jgi:DNA excision repair protein ERCC-2